MQLQKKYKELMKDIDQQKSMLATEEQDYKATLDARQSLKAGKRF